MIRMGNKSADIFIGIIGIFFSDSFLEGDMLSSESLVIELGVTYCSCGASRF